MRYILENNIDNDLTSDSDKATDSKTQSDKATQSTQDDTCENQEMSEREKLHHYDNFKLTKEQESELTALQRKKCLSNASLLIVSALGGAVTLYLNMFIQRFKLKNLLFMLVMPVLCGLNIFLLVQTFTVWIILA